MISTIGAVRLDVKVELMASAGRSPEIGRWTADS